MKAKEIILAILIIAAGAFIYYAQSGRLDWEFDGEHGFFFGNWDEFTYEETQDIEAPLPQELQVINAHGRVEIQGADVDRIRISLQKRIWRKSEADAKKVSAELKLVVNREEAKLVLSTNRDEFRQKRFETNFKITVPAAMNVLVRNSYGLVRIAKTGRTELTNPHGQVDVSDVEGGLTIESSYENILAESVKGACRITAPHADLAVRHIQGELVIGHSYGAIQMEDIEKDTTVDGSHSEIQGKNLRGRTEIASSYEKITLTEIGAAKIRARHCDVEIDGAKGFVDITDNYGRLQIANVQGNVRGEGPNLEVFAKSIVAEEISISTSNESVDLSGFTGKTSVIVNHGDITLEPDSITGSIDVRATYANVRLSWPKGERYPFFAEARSGQIHWGLADKPSVETTNGTSVTQAFTEEVGKPSLKITTSYGDIRVEEKVRTPKNI